MPYPESTDLAVDIWGGLNTSIPPSQLPMGASPACQDVAFPEAGVRTRDGLLPMFGAAAGLPAFNGLKTYTNGTLASILLAWDALGNLYSENSSGILQLISSGGTPSLFMNSTGIFGRQYLAFSYPYGDGKFLNSGGVDFPRQYDGTNYDRVSQIGPGAPPSVTDFLPGAVSIGTPGGGLSSAIAVSPGGVVWGCGGVIIWFDSANKPHTMAVWNCITVTTIAPHGFLQGQAVTLSGVGNANFNQVWVISAVLSPTSFKIGSSTFQLQQPQSGAGPNSGGGTASVGPPTTTTVLRQGNVVTVFTSLPHGFLPGWFVTITGIPNIAVGGGIAAISQAGAVVTVVMTTPHNLLPGEQIIVGGVTDATYNGSFQVQTVIDAKTFTYNAITANPTSSSGTVSTTFDVTAQISSTPTANSFTFSQLGPNQSSTSGGTATIVGTVAPGFHQCSVSFITRQGYITKPAPPITFVAAGNKLLAVSNIPIGPSNVTQRLLMFSPAIQPPGPPTATQPFSTLPKTMIINDNVTTSVVVDFSDTVLIAGESVQYLFGLIELGECTGVTSYDARTVFTGERNRLRNLVGLSFNGGWNLGGGTGGSDVPLGWTSDPVNGAGGSRIANGGVWLDAYQITGPNAGMITQSAAQDYLLVPIFNLLTGYSVRMRAKATAGAAGNLIVEIFSPSAGPLASIAFPLANFSPTGFSEQILALTTGLAVPTDALFRLYTDSGVLAGQSVTIDSLEPFPTASPVNTSIAWISYAFDPESFDATLSQVQVRPSDGQALRAGFSIRGNLYLGKERYLAGTTDDGQNEPSGWGVFEVSDKIGISSPNAVDTGEEWAAFANRDGAYLFWGSDPVKISQEIQEDASNTGKVVWNTTDWTQAMSIWAQIDQQNKRILFGMPLVNQPNIPSRVTWSMDYKFQDTGADAASSGGAAYSMFMNRLIQHGGGRKWAPWNIAANSCCLSERPDGTARVFLGNSAGNGKIYQLTQGKYSDDGLAINSFYVTAAMPGSQQEQELQLKAHRKICDYLVGLARGSGSLILAVESPVRTTFLRPVALKDAPTGDFERNVNMHGERFFYLLGTNAVGDWFQGEKLVPMVKPDPTMPVAGVY